MCENGQSGAFVSCRLARATVLVWAAGDGTREALDLSRWSLVCFVLLPLFDSFTATLPVGREIKGERVQARVYRPPALACPLVRLLALPVS